MKFALITKGILKLSPPVFKVLVDLEEDAN